MLRGQGGGPGVKIMIFFVLTYVLALVMRILKWAHTPSNSRRMSFYGSWREAPTRSFSRKMRGEKSQKIAPKSTFFPNFSALEVNVDLLLVLVQNLGIIYGIR